MCLCIRAMKTEDLTEILKIENIVFDEGWSEVLFSEELENPLSYYVTAIKDNVVVGYGGIMVTGIESDITKVAVSPDYQHQGIGMMVLAELINAAQQCGSSEIFLEVRSDNDNAIMLYEKGGFWACGRRFGYYKDKDAILMKLELDNDKE